MFSEKYIFWCTKEIQQIGNIRACLLHWRGFVKDYKVYVSNDKKLESIRAVDLKYTDLNPRRKDPESETRIYLTEENILEFFDKILGEGLDFITKKTQDYFNLKK